MANKESVIELLYSVKDEIKLSLTEYQWPKDYKLKYYDFEIRFEFEGSIYVGRGIDGIESIAIEKAASEAIERLICSVNGVDTVGVSVGISFNAELHARYEALERYFLNYRLEKNISFEKYSGKTKMIDDFSRAIGDVNFELFRIVKETELFGFGCVLTKGATKSVGFGMGTIESDAINKAFLEALPNLFWLSDSHHGVDRPWHLKDSFINQLESLISTENKPYSAIRIPTLLNVHLPVDSISFLKQSKVKAYRFVIAANE